MVLISSGYLILLFQQRSAVPIEKILKTLLDSKQDGEPEDLSHLLEGMKRKRNKGRNKPSDS